MRTACDGCTGPFDGVFEVFTGAPSIAPALVLPIEERGALEFSLLGISPVDIVSASLLLTVAGVHSGPAPIVEIHGFVGDGTVSLTDMQISNLLQTIGPLTTREPLAPIDVTAFVLSKVSDGTLFVGFTFRDIVNASAMFCNFTTDVPKLQVITTTQGNRNRRRPR
jgi:hypothetical protein